MSIACSPPLRRADWIPAQMCIRDRDSTKAGCTTLGYDRYLCMECGTIEQRDYVDSLGHAWQGIVIRDATCEPDGKLLELCSRCGQMKQTATPKGEHSLSLIHI